MIIDSHPLILFDGVCNLCNGAVQFILRNDPKDVFRFTSLQSNAGKAVLSKFSIPQKVQSFILIENDKAYFKSTAALRVLRKCRPSVSWLYGFIIVPAFIRNLLYDFIAINRYSWLGKKEECMIPGPEIKNRFID